MFLSHFLSLITFSSLGILLSLDLFAQTIALGEDVVSQIVNRVCWTNPIHVNHTLSQHWDDLFHQELAHVKIRSTLEFLHVLEDRLKTTILQAFKFKGLRIGRFLHASFGCSLF